MGMAEQKKMEVVMVYKMYGNLYRIKIKSAASGWLVADLHWWFGGKTGIRTLGTRKGTTVFETVPIDHSGIFPWSFTATKLQIVLDAAK